MLHQLRGCRCLLDDRAFGRKIAAQHGDTAALEYRIIKRPNHILLPRRRCGFDVFAERIASDGQRIEIQQFAYLAQHHNQSARLFQILHVMLTRRFEINQHRRFAPHFVEGIKVNLYPQTPSHCGEMHNRVG